MIGINLAARWSIEFYLSFTAPVKPNKCSLYGVKLHLMVVNEYFQ